MLTLLLAFSIGLIPPQAEDLTAAIDAAARKAHGKVGMAAEVLETHQKVRYHADVHYPMHSVYKFPIGIAVLREVDKGHLSLDSAIHIRRTDLVPSGVHSPLREKNPNGEFDVPVREAMRLMICESDGTASDAFMRILGGPEPIANTIHGLGVRDIAILASEKEMAGGPLVQYKNWVTPVAMVDLLGKFYKGAGLSRKSREFMMDLLTSTKTGVNRLRAGLPPDAVLAHKTGTGPRDPDGFVRATNDVGIVKLPNGNHLAIAVFVSDSREDDGTREGVIAEISRICWDRFSKPG